jgi:hypothetical protein
MFTKFYRLFRLNIYRFGSQKDDSVPDEFDKKSLGFFYGYLFSLQIGVDLFPIDKIVVLLIV